MKKNPSKLLENFRRHVLNSSENVEQQVYSALMSRPSVYEDNVITATLLNNTEVKLDTEPFLSCVRASGVPIKEVKLIEATMEEITAEDWESFYIMSVPGGTHLEILRPYYGAYYSPRILEMLQSYKLRKFR